MIALTKVDLNRFYNQVNGTQHLVLHFRNLLNN